MVSSQSTVPVRADLPGSISAYLLLRLRKMAVNLL